MIPHFKGNGGLIIIYFLVLVILTGLIASFLNQHNIQVDDCLIFSIVLLLTAICTYFTKDVYIKDKDGNKIKVDFKSSLFFIDMKYWVYILLIGALILFSKHLLN
jgi:hypothetical protein